MRHAEQAGFDDGDVLRPLLAVDHQPGSQRLHLVWLGAALATTSLSFGCVSAPGQRYHPAVLAQKIATLGVMFPGRFWVALGSGEASNEHITGDGWPDKEHRTRRLEECVEVIRSLLDGETVSHDGLVTVDRARVWERADPVPLLVGSCGLGRERRAASPPGPTGWSPSTNRSSGCARSSRRTATQAAAVGSPSRCISRGPRPPTRRCASPMTSGRPTSSGRRSRGTRPPWRHSTRWPARCRPRRCTTPVRVSADLSRHREWLAEYADLGFDDLYLHHVGQHQTAFIDAFGEHVLPELRRLDR